MSWAAPYIAALKEGRNVTFRPSGHSMTGKVNHRDLVELSPLKDEDVIKAGAIVLCKVKGSVYLHLVRQVDAQGRYLIGNNKGGINGWCSREHIFGQLIYNFGAANNA